MSGSSFLNPLEAEFARRWKSVGVRLKNKESLETIVADKPHLKKYMDESHKSYIKPPGPPLQLEEEGGPESTKKIQRQIQ
jgi:hypothetical protein